MKQVLVTGGRGFLGRNLVTHLQQRQDCRTRVIDVEDSADDLREALLSADVVFHLAGVNRPKEVTEYATGNIGLTEQICGWLRENGRTPKIVFSSSIQAALDNPYGTSKAGAEAALQEFAAATGANVKVYRLKNLFGKWCRPNYNSVTATFCYNIANELPITVADPSREIELSYVDDVVMAFLAEIDGEGTEIPSYELQLGDLAGRIQAFHEMRATLQVPDFSDWFNHALYATYLSYLSPEARNQDLTIRSDNRGSLAEFIKSAYFGQIFISRTKPGITRGNHYHHTKTEKFLVVEGEGLIRMRPIDGTTIDEYRVSGADYRVVNIPPGLTHSITNVGSGEMVTLFWSSEIFDPNRPDTYYMEVQPECKEPASVIGK